MPGRGDPVGVVSLETLDDILRVADIVSSCSFALKDVEVEWHVLQEREQNIWRGGRGSNP